MKKTFLLLAFIIAAVCTAPLEAMNSETEEDNRVRVPAQTKQTTIGQHFRPVNHPGIPTPDLDALAAPQLPDASGSADSPPRIRNNRNKILAPFGWVGRVFPHLNQ